MDKNLEYIETFLKYPNPILSDLEKPEADVKESRNPHLGIHAGTFLWWLVMAMDAKRVMEFGTCAGYSTVFLAEALKSTHGKLIAVEFDHERADNTKNNLEKAGLLEFVDVIEGDAAVVINEVEGPFDIILQDSDKPLYPKMLDACVDKLRPGGVLAADDALFLPQGVSEANSKPLHEYNQKVFAHPQLASTIIPTGDGLTLSVKVIR